MEDWRELTFRATVVLLVTSFVLIGPGLAGVGASLALTLALVALGLALVAARPYAATLPTVVELDLGTYAQDLWLGPLLGATILVFFPDASPTELQALGGFAGLLGMVNYFVRPLYFYLYALVSSVVRAG